MIPLEKNSIASWLWRQVENKLENFLPPELPCGWCKEEGELRKLEEFPIWMVGKKEFEEICRWENIYAWQDMAEGYSHNDRLPQAIIPGKLYRDYKYFEDKKIDGTVGFYYIIEPDDKEEDNENNF